MECFRFVNVNNIWMCNICVTIAETGENWDVLIDDGRKIYNLSYRNREDLKCRLYESST